MTKRNNYDKSSTGIDIECICFYDTVQARMEWEENFKTLSLSRYGTDKAYYIDYGNVPDDESLTFSVKGTKEEKIRFILSDGDLEKDIVENWDDETLDNQILNEYGDRVSLVTYQDCNTNMLSGFDLEIIPSKKIKCVSIRGYSQGDYCDVYYCPDDLKEAWGKEPNESELQEMLTYLFYDAPIFARFTINDEEYDYHDMPGADQYEWKRKEFLEYVYRKSGVSIGTLAALLPEDPDYD